MVVSVGAEILAPNPATSIFDANNASIMVFLRCGRILWLPNLGTGSKSKSCLELGHTVQYCTVMVFAELLFMEGIKWPYPHGFSELLQISTRGPYDRTKVVL